LTGIVTSDREAALVSVSRALRPLQFGWARRLLGKAAFLGNARQIKRRYNAFALERIVGVPIFCIPGVFNPKLMRTGEFFASHLSAAEIAPGSAVLDMGTGSGVCAIVAARRTAQVIAVDINPEAVRCATANVWLNNVQDAVKIKHGDLFSPVGNDRFDLVLFNPPFIHGTPENDLDRAWRSTDVAERFARELPRHLKPNGQALVLLSTFGNSERFVAALHKQSLSMSVIATRRYLNERLTIVRVHVPQGPGTGAIR
jgi:release factor glutamine methyltransferase